MAVVFMDGFDHYIASLAIAKGWSGAPNSMQTGRFGGQSFRMTSGSRTRVLPSNYSTLFAGFAFRFGSLPTATGDVFVLRNGATNTYRIQLRTDGKLQIVTSGGTVVATGTTVLNTTTWYYIETKAVINGASGSCELRLNGVAGEIGTTTGNFGSSNIDGLLLTLTTGQTSSDFDDLCVVDTTGSAPRNTFLGDCRVETLYPSADGAHTQFTPNSGSPHFSRVNEHTGTFPDDDTSYVSDATPGDIDSYAVDDLSISSGTVYAVQTNLYARKDDAGTRQIADVVRQGGVDTVGTTQTMAATYAFFMQVHNQDPSSADWSISNVNADEFGVKVIA